MFVNNNEGMYALMLLGIGFWDGGQGDLNGELVWVARMAGPFWECSLGPMDP